MWVFCIHVCLYTICIPGAHGGQKGTGVRDGYELPCGCCDSNSGPLEEHPVPLTAEPSLQL